jgi:nitronate monooxygenase
MSISDFTALVGCRHPLQQAGMGGSATPELAAAVSEAGALGMLGAGGIPADAVSDLLNRVEALTSAPVGINFLMPFVDPGAVEVAAQRVRVVEFFYGEPDSGLVERVHRGGAVASWQVGSRREARAAAAAGVDLVVAQGVEAGGHVRGEVGIVALLDEVIEAVDLPVLAAGGIASADAVAGVLAAGAAGARVGTRFLAAAEANVHPAYLEAMVAAGPEDTVLTTTFSLFWPDAPHRVLRSCVEAAEKLSDPVAGYEGDPGRPIPTRSPSPPGRATTGQIGAMALYAGQSVGRVRRVEPAADIVRELVSKLPG